jgi:hypothetical protein
LFHEGMGNIWPVTSTIAMVKSTIQPKEAVHIKLTRSPDDPAPSIVSIMDQTLSAGAASASASASAGAGAGRSTTETAAGAVTPSSVSAGNKAPIEELHQPAELQHTSDKILHDPNAPVSNPHARAAAGSVSSTTGKTTTDSKATNFQTKSTNTSDADADADDDEFDADAAEEDADIEEEADTEEVDMERLHGRASSSSTESVASAVLQKQFRVRLKYLLRSQIARKILSDAYAIDRKTQGVWLPEFVDSIEFQAEDGSGSGLSKQLINTILTGADSIVTNTVIPLFAEFINQQLASHGGKALDDSVVCVF